MSKIEKTEEMFCYQCEQRAGCSGCTGARGVCGKSSKTALLQDQINRKLWLRLQKQSENRMYLKRQIVL